MMDAGLSANWTPARVMQTFPQTISVFLALKTGCVGCHLRRFCTLAEVAVAHEIPLETLLEQLRESAMNPMRNKV